LCFERRYPKQNSDIRLKSNILVRLKFPPPKLLAGYTRCCSHQKRTKTLAAFSDTERPHNFWEYMYQFWFVLNAIFSLFKAHLFVEIFLSERKFCGNLHNCFVCHVNVSLQQGRLSLQVELTSKITHYSPTLTKWLVVDIQNRNLSKWRTWIKTAVALQASHWITCYRHQVYNRALKCLLSSGYDSILKHWNLLKLV